MYSSRSGMVYGFHGLEQEVGMKILKKKEKLRPSEKGVFLPRERELQAD